MKFYERIFNRRTENINTINSHFEMPVLEQLLLIAFNNDSFPGELPDEFIVSNILIPKDSFEKLLKELGINTFSIDYIKGSYGNSFKISLKI